MISNLKKSRLPLAITFLLILMLALLSGCGAPPKLPATPTLVVQIPHTFTPAPTATPTHTPTPKPTQTPTPAPTATPTVTKANASAAKATVKPQAVAPTATPGVVTLVVTEAQANKMAKKALADQKDVQIDNVRVDFRPDEMFVSGDTKIGFFTLNIGLLVTIKPVHGKPEVSVEEITVNNSPATGFIRSQIETMISPHLKNLAMVEDTFYVESISITNDKMVVTGRYK